MSRFIVGEQNTEILCLVLVDMGNIHMDCMPNTL
jgi:hypothetical protein